MEYLSLRCQLTMIEHISQCADLAHIAVAWTLF